MNKIILRVVFLSLCPMLSFGTMRSVPGSYGNIQAAVTAATSGDVIDIAAGTYSESNIFCNKSLTIQGAGMGQTIVQAHTSAFKTPATNSMVFNLEFTPSSNVTITIQNMTIQNGYNSGSGGGIRVYNKFNTSPTIYTLGVNLTNVNLLNNSAVNGGGLYLLSSGNYGPVTATLSNCKINGNIANGGGGGVYAVGPVNLNITGCNVNSNAANGTDGGGGISLAPGTVYPLNTTIKNSSISNNTIPSYSTNNGAGINVTLGNNGATAVNHTLWIENTTVYANSNASSGHFGGGICFKTSSGLQTVTPTQTLTLNHCTVANNTTTAGTGGDGICFDNNSYYSTTLVMNNSIVMGNSGSISNASQIGQSNSSQTKVVSDGHITNSIFGIKSGATWVTAGTTNNNLTAVTSDLCFFKTLSSDAIPVLKIGAGSVATNFVTTDYLSPVLTTDQIGNARVGNADAGAYEVSAGTHTYTVEADGSGDFSTIQNAVSAAGSADIVTIGAGTYTEKFISCSNKSVTIQGAGMSQTIVQAYATPNNTPAVDSEVFCFDGTYLGGVTVTLQNMTLQNGYNTASGGGIRLVNLGIQGNAPTFNFTNLKVYNNTAGIGGGGIYIEGPTALTLTGCNITGNTASGAKGGGGVSFYPNASSIPLNATIKKTTISNNVAAVGPGGGISAILANSSSSNVLWIENSTIYGNSTSASAMFGGGIAFKTSTSGSSSPNAALTINHCTIAYNTTNAATGGDGVGFDNNGSCTTTFVMNNSIVMGNSGSTSNQSQVGQNAASQTKITNGGVTNSIFGIWSGGNWVTAGGATNNNLMADVNIGTLAFAGALSSHATPVLTIGNASVAKNFVSSDYISPVLTTDQVLNARIGNADAGAYEYGTAQTISFGALAAKSYGNAPYAISATGGGSGNPVTFTSSDASVATVSGTTVTVVGVGSCTIYANQAGVDPYAAAPQVGQTLTVNAKPLTVPSAAAVNKYYDGTNAAIITGTLFGVVNSDVVTLSGTGTFASSALGTGIAVTSTSTLGGANASNYTLTQPVGLTANITQAPQDIVFDALPTKLYSDVPFALTATASSGLTVSYASSNTAVATISGSTVTIVAPGSTNITASQAGNGSFAAATNVIQALTVSTEYDVSTSLNVSNALFTAFTDITVMNNGVLNVDVDKDVHNVTVSPGGKLNLAANRLTVTDLVLAVGKSTAPSVSVTNAMTVNGAVKMLKTLDSSIWYFISLPCDVAVNSITQVSGAFTVDFTNLGSKWWIKYYNGKGRASNGGATTNWVDVVAGETLHANKGYIIGLNNDRTGDYVLSFPLNSGLVTAAESATSTSVGIYGKDTVAVSNVGWNLVGVPYLSKFNGDNVGVNFVTVFNGSSYDQYANTDAAVDYLNPFSSFFVQASTTSLSFGTGGRRLVSKSVANDLTDRVQINVTNGTGTDNTTLIMDDTQSIAYELNQDLGKWLTTGTDKPQIYSVLNGVNYAFNSLPMGAVQDLPLGVYTKVAGSDTIHVDASNAPGISQLLLTDKVTGITTDLLNSDYSFTATAGTTTSRFSISAQRVVTNKNVVQSINTPCLISREGKLIISNLAGNTTVRVFDTMGRVVVTEKVYSNTLELPLSVGGVYTIHIQNDSKSWTGKVVVRE